MSKGSIYVHAESDETAKSNYNITHRHWKVYYYLLSISKFNSKKVEDHRYIYKNSFNKSEASRILGIGRATIYRAIDELKARKLIVEEENYYLIYAKNWVPIEHKTLTNLIEFAPKAREHNIDILRIFLILKRIDQVASNDIERSFTTRQLIILLGRPDNKDEYYDEVRMYLAMLSFWGMISLKQHEVYNPKNGAYVVYHLQEIKDLPTSPISSNIYAEKDSPLPSEEFMNELKFSFSEILDSK